MPDWDLTPKELLEKGDVGEQKALAGIVIGAGGSVLVKYGDSIKFIQHSADNAAQISADLFALVAKARVVAYNLKRISPDVTCHFRKHAATRTDRLL